jgi:hypothetical protein
MGFDPESGRLTHAGGSCRAWEMSVQVLAIKDALKKEDPYG